MKNKDKKKRPTLCVELLNTFTKKELADFSKFVSSDYFNTDKLVIKLLDALKKWGVHITFFDAKAQQKVYQNVFGNLPNANQALQKKHKNTLNLKLNALLRLAEKFLSVEQLQSDKWSKLDYLYLELLKRKQYPLYKRHFNKDVKTIQTEKIKDLFYYENLYKTYWINLEYLSASRKIVEEENIDELIEYNDLSYLLKKLNIQITLLSLVDYPQKKYNHKTFKLMQPLLAYPPYAHNNQIKLSLINIDLLKDKNMEVYKKLLHFINNYEDSLSKIDLRGLYQLAINFCTYQIRIGNYKFYDNVVSIYHMMHQKDLLIINNTMSAVLITNIITAICKVGKYNRALEISSTYLKYVDKSIQKSIYHYNMGIISFFKKEFDQSHNNFLNVSKTNTLLDLNARVYILKCLYENTKEYSHYFVQTIRSLKEYLKNQHKIPWKAKKGYLNLTKSLLQLYQFKFGKGKFALKDVEAELNKQVFYSNKVWLLEKIKELKAT